MRKLNWLITVILVLASAFLLWLWYYLQFNTVDDPFDLVLSIIWWVVVIGLVLLVFLFEKRRRRAVRTVYVASGAVFNNELGLVECTDPAQRAACIEKMLAGLKYGFSRQDLPSKDSVRFDYVVTSDVFKKKRSSDKEGAGASAQASGQAPAQGGTEERAWEGTVVRIVRGGDNVTTSFKNATELASLLS